MAALAEATLCDDAALAARLLDAIEAQAAAAAKESGGEAAAAEPPSVPASLVGGPRNDADAAKSPAQVKGSG